jgi:NAD dependent epimerase/dehydratase
MNWQSQTVLITGAGGFIGSHLTEQCVALGARTRALVRYNAANAWGWLDTSLFKDAVEVILGDLRDIESLRHAMRGVDIVYHLAALIAIPYSYQAPRSYVHTNVEGTLNVLQAARETGVRLVVHTSTSEVYGTARYVPIDEAHPLQGQSPYSASKIAADKMAEAFYCAFGVPVATIRPFNTFGPRQSARAVIPTIITQALTQPVIRLGNLAPTRDLNYVADTVAGFISMAECPAAIGQVINVGSGHEISIGDLAQMIMELIGKVKPIDSDEQRVRPTDSEVERLCADNRRAKAVLDWQPQCSLRDGLEQTIVWVQEHLAQFRPGAYTV